MRIGVDARSLSEPIAGIGRYTLSLLELMVLDKSHEWVLYSHRPILHGQWGMQNVTVRALSFPKWVRGLYVPWSQFILPLWVKQDSIDLFWSPAHRLPRHLPKSIASVVTIHDLVWRHAPETMKSFGRFLDAKFMPEAIRIADQVIAVSESTERDLVSEVPEAKGKVNVVYEATSLDFVDFSKKFDKVDGEYILFVGTLEPRKNLARLIEAYSMLSESLRDKYSLVIVGGKGWGGVNLSNVIESSNVASNVKVLGYLQDNELKLLYHNAILFTMPSLYEGFGLPLLEAMSAGVPILTSNVSSMPEIAKESALYIDPYSVESIGTGITNMLMNDKLRESMSKYGLARAKQFSWDSASKETINVFYKAISSREV